MLEKCSFYCDNKLTLLYVVPEDYQRILDDLQDMSILFEYYYDEEKDLFESSFFSPEGLKIAVLEKVPSECLLSSEFTLDLASKSISDSVNFWHALGFEILDSPARAFAWVDLNCSGLRISIKDFIHLRENCITVSQ